MSEKTKHVVLGVTGSIAAYKAAELVRLIIGRGWEVSVIMTEAATEFVAPLTFSTLSRNPVSIGMFDAETDWRPEHISLADRGDVMVVAPCTANVIAKMAYGLADDLLSATALATSAPIVVAPAMNEGMWKNPATKANVETLKSRGVDIVDVGEGDLACGYEGQGRLAALDVIMNVISEKLGDE